MKLLPFLPPAAALAASAWVLAGQQQEIDSLNHSITRLRQTRETVLTPATAGIASSGTRDGRSSLPANGATPETPAGKPTLKDLAALLPEEKNNSMPDLRAQLKLENLLTGLSSTEIGSLLQEAISSGLTEAQKDQLYSRLIPQLAGEDPEAAVLASSQLLGSDSQNGSQAQWQINHAFELWADEDPSAAAAWLDQQVADGKFRNKSLNPVSEQQVALEANLFSKLLGKENNTARARLENLLPEERQAVLSQTPSNPTDPDTQIAYAGMVRDLVDPGKQADIISSFSRKLWLGEGLDGVSEFLSSINASEEERRKSVQDTAAAKATQSLNRNDRKLTAENSREWRTWIAKEMPEETDRLIGTVLAGTLSTKRLTFQEASALLPEFSSSENHDEIIAGFLENANWRSSPEEKAILAATISDAALRAAMLEKIQQ